MCVTFQVPLVLICKHKSSMPPPAGQEPGADQAEVVEERCLLAGSLWPTLTTLRATKTTSPEVASHSVSWSVPYQSSIKKNAPRFVHRPIWWEHFPDGGSHSQNDCNFISSWNKTSQRNWEILLVQMADLIFQRTDGGCAVLTGPLPEDALSFLPHQY